MGLLSDEDLSFKRAEFSVSAIIDNGSWRLPNFSVWQNDGWWDDPLILVVFDYHTGITLWIRRLFHAVNEINVFVTGWVAHETAGLEPFEGGRSIPESLVVGVKCVSQFVETDSSWRTNTRAGRGSCTIEIITITPPTPWRFLARTSRTSEAMNDPNVSIFIGIRSKIVLVIVTVNSPMVGYGFEVISSTVTISIREFCNFGALGHKK